MKLLLLRVLQCLLLCIAVVGFTQGVDYKSGTCTVEGNTYDLNEWFQLDACTKCTCTGTNTEGYLDVDCKVTPCRDVDWCDVPVQEPGPDECCPSCPTDITPPKPLDPLLQCYYNGRFYKSNEEYQPHPCVYCRCNPLEQDMCAIAGCAPLSCVDPVQNVTTDCCPWCPHGRSCMHGDIVIKEGESIEDCGMICSCQEFDLMVGIVKAKCIKPQNPDLPASTARGLPPASVTTLHPSLSIDAASATLSPKEARKAKQKN